MDKPILALDVDGVVNALVPLAPLDEAPEALCAPLSPDVAFHCHHVYVPKEDVPNSPYIRGQGTIPLDVTIRIDPEVISWLQRMQEKVTLVWATTWENAANLYISPLLGLPALPYLALSDYPSPLSWARTLNSVACKLALLKNNYPGTPLAYIDDSLFWPPSMRWRHCPYLFIAPDPFRGITSEHRQRVEEFLLALP